MHQSRPIAVVDIGSNSVRLMVAEAGAFLNPIYKDRRVTRLLQGMANGVLHPDSVARTAAALQDFIGTAREAGAARIEAFGTSALRDGESAGDIAEILKVTGVPLRILSGEEEAAIAYAGAAPCGNAGILDIGGGSTEWAVGTEGRVLASASANVGAVRLSQARLPGSARGPIEYAKAAMKCACAAMSAHPVDEWTGVGGSVMTLAAMIRQLETYSDEAVAGALITSAQAQSMYDLLIFMPPPLRLSLKGLEKDRADIIHFGIAILLAFFEMTGQKQIRVGNADNLMGYMRLYMSSPTL